MAALLRSARLLKLSPSGLLQITGTKRNGPPLSRLYSGNVGGHKAGVCSRQLTPGLGNTSRQVWSFAAGSTRGYSVATEQRDETSLGVRAKQAQQFDWALAKLDNSVRRTGRITKTLLLRIFHDICRLGYPSSNQALLLLRSCGSLLPEVPLAERNELAHRIWDRLKELGASYDVSHYNALLKVYLQNEFKFSSTEFLAKMEAANVQPNRVTYQRLIASYCQNGDIEGASTILGFMKSKDLPITEAVFNSLVTGHSRAGDIENAKNILSVMRGAGIEPGPDTYLSLLNAYAEKGDMENLKKTLEEAERADCSLMDRDIMQIMLSLARAGHQQYVSEIADRLRHERSFVPDAMNMCLSLITQGLEDISFTILKSFPTIQPDTFNTDTPNQGNFFLRHCVNMDKPAEKVVAYCRELQDSNLHGSPLQFTLSCALDAKKSGMSFELMKALKEKDFPIRPHYFWPLLIQHLKDSNTAGVLEVCKAMQELEVSPDMDTFSNYIIPVFPSVDAARQALTDTGLSLEPEIFLSSEVQALAINNLAELYTVLTDTSLPALDFGQFRGRLIAGFKKSTDVAIMAKITDLLYRDERFSKPPSKPSEAVGFFLYNFIENMADREVKAQEDKLREYFHQLKAQNVGISVNIYRGIRNLLDSAEVPELLKDVATLVYPKDQPFINSVSAGPTTSGVEGKVVALEKSLADMKVTNKPLSATLKQTIAAHCAEENLERALELKRQHEEDMTAGAYASLINLCCRRDNFEEALNLKREMERMDSSIVLDASKYIGLIRTLSTNGRVEEAVDLLKEMKEKDVVVNDTNTILIFHTLNILALKGDITAIRQLGDTLFTLGLAKPSANLCSPLVTAYLSSNDLSGALEAAMDCQKSYRHMPRIHDIIVALVEKGETELLQKAMDFVSQERGEMTMLYDLYFAFMQTGRYREARKILETPGLRAKPGRLQWYAEKCITNKQMETLEQMVDMTEKLFECDRDEMYSYLLRLCKETNNWQKAEILWTKMQEENIIPRERTLTILADILKSNGQEVPFDVPETWYQQAATTATTDQASSASKPAKAEGDADYRLRILALCKKGKSKEAYELLKDADKKGIALGPVPYDHLIRALFSDGFMEDGMAVKDIATSHLPSFHFSDTATSLLIITHSKRGQSKDGLNTLKSMLQANQVPSLLSITRLVQAMGSQGDVAGIQEVESLMKGLGTPLNLSSMVFVNNTALAHIKNGNLEAAVELLEAIYTDPETTSPSISFVFRKILEEGNDKALDKLNAMAERLANHFSCYRPASDLFLQLLEMDKVEDAKFMLARCNALAEQKDVLVSYIARMAQRPGQVGKIKNLMSVIPDFSEKEILYPYMMKCYSLDKDLASAKALYEQMQNEGIEVNELTLKRLAMLYRNAGEVVPFSEPPESFKFYAEKLKEKVANA
ncbi:leucine-rich PPR motif-containing protein, mitochondrial [Lampris incognitus]|uniref:leucine-rich PPR motif-containing protein, mitochondrial n=1 Tax=Lampris incognitus TaxID=2546036 RepID=UPI0024B5853A|nr:leucine-rich PPR motif-containing protein, mitochondrial [Lampris incognitus]